MGKGFHQGVYTPKYPDKYIGDVTKIVFRSSWELEMNKFLDNNPNIVEWASEELSIPYIKPTDGRVHKYFVDYYIKYFDKQGNVIKELIEVKPEKQTKAPKRVGKNKRTQLYEQVTYAINIAKWKAATNFANQHGMKFRIITEKNMFR